MVQIICGLRGENGDRSKLLFALGHNFVKRSLSPCPYVIMENYLCAGRLTTYSSENFLMRYMHMEPQESSDDRALVAWDSCAWNAREFL